MHLGNSHSYRYRQTKVKPIRNTELENTHTFEPVSKPEKKSRGPLVPISDHNARKLESRGEKRRSTEGFFLQENRPISLLKDLPPAVADVKEDNDGDGVPQSVKLALLKCSYLPEQTTSLKTGKNRREDAVLTRKDLNPPAPSIRADEHLTPPLQENRTAKESHADPNKTLRSSRRGRATPDSLPNRNLSLDAQTVEHLRPLTELGGVACTRDIHLWHAEWTSFCTIVKIAEGTYGSVFRMSDKLGSHRPTIGKLMPLKAKSGVGSKKVTNTSIADAVSEIKLLELMNDVPGFVAFRGAEVLMGPLPKALREEYVAFQERESCRNGFNDSYSAAETSFPRHQAWIFIEMDNAGIELERALTDDDSPARLFITNESGERYLPVQRIRDIFWGVVEALARGEELHRFEHRDLHLSNICIAMDQSPEIQEPSGYGLIPRQERTVVVTIIDYTLSRATLHGGDVIFNPMSDLGIFEGDGEVDLQFDIYRHMRELVSAPPPKGQLPTPSWGSYHPVTNVLWLHLLLKKLMALTTTLSPSRSPSPSPSLSQPNEEELWLSLRELEKEINVERRAEYDLLSACDVARCMEVGKTEFIREVAEVEGQTRRSRLLSSGGGG